MAYRRNPNCGPGSGMRFSFHDSSRATIGDLAGHKRWLERRKRYLVKKLGPRRCRWLLRDPKEARRRHRKKLTRRKGLSSGALP